MPEAGSAPPTSCPGQRVVLVIDGTTIPTVEIETFHNKDGVADRNTFTRAIVPTSWEGQDILSDVNVFGSDDGYFDAADIYWQDASQGTWVHNQSGYVRAKGGGPQTGTAKLILGGWSQLFTAIRFSKTYDSPTVGTVLNDVTSTVNEKVPISLSATGIGSPSSIQEPDDPIGATGPTGIGGGVDDDITVLDMDNTSFENDTIQTTKNFVYNRHTLKDVMEWLCGEANARWYIDIDGGSPILILDTERNSKHYYDASLGQSPACRVINNDAIQEISPINGITVNGKSSMGTDGFRIKQLSAGKFPTATVQYDPLVNAANGEMLQPIIESQTLSVDATENKAKRELQKKISGATDGDITMFGKPDIVPLDHFTGVPTCDTHHVGDAPPIEYEVTEVQHRTVGGKEFGTRIGVNIWVDESKITTKNATMKSQ